MEFAKSEVSELFCNAGRGKARGLSFNDRSWAERRCVPHDPWRGESQRPGPSKLVTDVYSRSTHHDFFFFFGEPLHCRVVEPHFFHYVVVKKNRATRDRRTHYKRAACFRYATICRETRYFV